jgi:hypothetical protein
VVQGGAGAIVEKKKSLAWGICLLKRREFHAELFSLFHACLQVGSPEFKPQSHGEKKIT